MFVDVAKIQITAGDGGDGAVAFHREKYVAAGGPDGGDGGRGGNIIFKADDNLSTLADFRYKRKYKAPKGENGRGARCNGKKAEDLVIRVPRGTLIKDANTGRIIADISDDEPVIVAKGGRGGWGNTHFATPTRQTPRFAKPGLPGESMEVSLELKLLADVGLVGYPNVGKSTLMNLLSGYERSIVTDIPGTTRDVIEDTVMLGDIPLCLSDTAGIRATDDPVESIGVEKARKRVKSAGLVLAVFDSSKELCDDDRELIELIKDCPSVAVINKSDLKTAIDMDYIKKNVRNVVFISAKSGSGASELEKVVSDIIGTSQLDPSAAIIANERQRDCAKRARDFLNEAINALEMGITLDAVTVIIEDAISALLELTGERASEAVVDSVFSHFCVGK